MNWGRVKTVLIILFLCTDIFLIGIYMTSRYSSSAISDEVIEDTVTVLANNKITINPDIIPRKSQSVAYAEAENVISDYETFAKNLLGSDIRKTDFGFESDVGKVTFYGDRFNFARNPEMFLLVDTIGIENEQKAQDVATESLNMMGFDLSNASASLSKEDSSYTVIFENTANSLPIFNSRVTVVLSQNGVMSVSGIWFNQTASSGDNVELKKVTSALIDFIPQIPESSEIVKLEIGYNIFDKESFHKSATLIPVWHITCKDGNTYLLDARNL